jgi:transposase
MKPYSKDLRLKVLAAVDRGMPRKEVARVFGVSEPTIRRYLRLRRQTGDVEPRPLPGPPARKREALEHRLPAQVRLNPDLTLEEHCELFEETIGMEVSSATMSRAFKRLGLPLKKVAPGRRARRRAEGALAKRGAGDRPRALRLRGRVRYAHLHDAPVREGSSGRAGLR